MGERFAQFECSGAECGAGEAIKRRSGPGEEDARPLRDVLVPIPLAFLGLGVYRAWIEITFVGSFAGF